MTNLDNSSSQPSETPERLALISALETLQASIKRAKGRKLWTYYPDDGPLRRELYPKHMQFFEAGKAYRERCMMAGNRVGKTESVGGYEVTLHLTGLYPDWWPGRRFDRPVAALAAGTTAIKTRDINQKKLCGEIHDLGTGLIPANCIGEPTSKAGIAKAFDTLQVKHVSGRMSILRFRSYDQGRTAFEGEEQDIVWLDEEPPKDIYDECLVRTMTTKGIVLCTFTPLLGLTEVALSFMPNLAPQTS